MEVSLPHPHYCFGLNDTQPLFTRTEYVGNQLLEYSGILTLTRHVLEATLSVIGNSTRTWH
jgi:hypothetical protein